MVQTQELERAEGLPAEEAQVVLLATSAAAGDEGAFAELYELLSQRVFNLVLRSVHDRPTAEDLCQEIWLRAHGEIRNLRAPEALRSWLYRIASHACVDFARSSRGKHRNDESEIDEFIVAYGPQPEDTAILGSEVRMVWETLGSMAPRQSMALYLRQVDGLSYDEIASVLECNRPTVEALLFRARQTFVRAYHRVETRPGERCEMFSQVMASIIDNEPTALQRSALESHAADCAGCRRALAETRKANRAYLALPLLPIGKGLALEVILAGGGATAGAGFVSTVAGLLGAGAFQAKVVFVGALLMAGGGAVATGQVDVPVVSDSIGVHDSGSVITPGVASETQGAEASGLSEHAPLDGGIPALTSYERDSTPGPTLASPSASRSNLAAGSQDTVTSPAAGPERIGSPSEEGADVTTAAASPGVALEDASGSQAAVAATPVPGGAGTQDGGSGTSSSASSSPGATPAATTNALQQTTSNLTGTTTGVLNDVGELAIETLGTTGVVVGETLNSVVQPVATVIEPADSVVEDVTGISVNETLDDVLNALPSSSATPVPLDETIEDVLEPVGGLLEDPLQPVEDLLEDPLGPVEDLAGPLLGPLLPPAPTPQPTATPQPGASPTAVPTATPEEGPCLLGLLFC